MSKYCKQHTNFHCCIRVVYNFILYTKSVMLEPWNDASILPPPVHTVPSSVCSINSRLLKHICKNMLQVLSKQSPLHREGAVTSRFLYKFDRKFRHDIGYRNLKKMNTALRKYLALDILKDIERFESVVPADGDEYVPTRQMLQFVLVRLMTLAKLMVRVNVCAKQSAIFYLNRIRRGESHWMSLMPYALVSRVSSLCMVLLRHICGWYRQLHPFLINLQAQGVPFIPDEYQLPVDLESWLDMENIDNVGRYEWSQRKCVEVDQVLVDEDDDDTNVFVNILNYMSQVDDEAEEMSGEASVQVEPPLIELKPTKELDASTKLVDYGEPISRDNFTSLKSQIKDTHYYHSDKMVTNKHSLQQFLNKEETFRNEGKDCLTQHLSFMQWQALKSSLQKLCDSLSTSNRKIERKFQKIWQEKCLDYK